MADSVKSMFHSHYLKLGPKEQEKKETEEEKKVIPSKSPKAMNIL